MLKWNVKDGGPESPVTFFGIEVKWLGSIGFIKFAKGCREAYHTHAFHALTWFLKGELIEDRLWAVSRVDAQTTMTKYTKGILPKITSRKNMHRVSAGKDSWCFTLRGPWKGTWREYDPKTGLFTVFSNGREVVGTYTAT